MATASVGAVYLIGRFIYLKAYVESPPKRHIGFIFSILPVFILIIMAIVGMMKNFDVVSS